MMMEVRLFASQLPWALCRCCSWPRGNAPSNEKERRLRGMPFTDPPHQCLERVCGADWQARRASNVSVAAMEKVSEVQGLERREKKGR